MKFNLNFLNHKPKLVFLAAFLFTLSASLTYLYFSPHSPTFLSPESSPSVLSAKISDPTPLPPPEDLTTLNFLLLGSGGAGHQGGLLTDVIQLAHFDFENALLAFISIPRDLWYLFPDGQGRKINSAFALGTNTNQLPTENVKSDQAQTGATAAKAAITTITALPIDYFIAVDFVGYQRTIGYGLDGIEVNVPETLDDAWYPIKGLEVEPCGHTPQEITKLSSQYSGFELEKQFPCRYEHIHFEKGQVTMDGGDALKYVRSRHGSSNGDFSRSQRQQAVFLGIRDKLFSLETLDNIPKFFSEITQYFQTDIDENLVSYIAPALRNIKDFKVINITLSPENVLTSSKSNSGAFILLPKSGSGNWQDIHSFIKDQLKQT